VTLAENGQIAMDLALAAEGAGEGFDIVLMDIQMPVMDGFEATRRLRQMGYTRPIIALTANAMNEDRQRCIDAGCDDYLSKPANRTALAERIAAWTSEPKPASAVTASGVE
jgi:CheY-like chemotaxis protein